MIHMSLPFNIFLVGPMGAGKSTIGKRLAQLLNTDFADSDREIESHTGANIPLIFELEGEAGFRQRESDILDKLTAQHHLVLATGGGSVLLPQNQKMLQQRGKVVYLYTTVKQQLQRTRRDQNRPLLQTDNPEEKLQQLFAERDPIYRKLADITIDTDGRSIHSVSHEIIKRLQLKPDKKSIN
jgi:shikimate kinase